MDGSMYCLTFYYNNNVHTAAFLYLTSKNNLFCIYCKLFSCSIQTSNKNRVKNCQKSFILSEFLNFCVSHFSTRSALDPVASKVAGIFKNHLGDIFVKY